MWFESIPRKEINATRVSRRAIGDVSGSFDPSGAANARAILFGPPSQLRCRLHILLVFCVPGVPVLVVMIELVITTTFGTSL